MFKKTFIKIFLIVFLFTILQNSVLSNKAFAWWKVIQEGVDVGASFTDPCLIIAITTTATIYALENTSSHLSGDLRLCYKGQSGATLKLYKDSSETENNLLKTLTANGSFTETSSSTAFSATDFSSNAVKIINFILTDSNGNNPATARFDLTLKPAWNVKYYNSDGTTQILNGKTNGTNVFNNKVIKSGENTSTLPSEDPADSYKPTAPSNGSWAFGGWYTTSAFTTAFDFNLTVANDTWTFGNDVTIYAKWTLSCSSGYVLNTAGNACVKIVCTNGASTTTKSTSNGTCPSISTSGNVVLTTTKTFYCSTSSVYPQGKYSDTENPVGGVTATTTNTCNTKVFFNKNNTDSGSTDANPTFRAVNVYDENVTTPTTNPTRTGYKFLGWAPTPSLGTIQNSSSTNSTINIDSVNPEGVTLYAKWEAVPTECGIDTLVNKTGACPPLITSQINNTPTTTTISTNKNGAWAYPQNNIIFNLKYGDTFKTTCSSTTRIDLYNASNTNITGSDVSSPFTTSNSYDYDYGNTNSVYTILCQNIGGHTVSGNSVYTQFRTPKKFVLKFKNPNDVVADDFTSVSYSPAPATNLAKNQKGDLWDGQAIATPTPPTRSGYAFDGWYSSSTLQNNTTIFNFSNTNWTDLTNGGEIKIYAKWNAVCTPSDTTSTSTENVGICTLPRTGSTTRIRQITVSTAANCSITTSSILTGATSTDSCQCPTNYTWNSTAGKCQITCSDSNSDGKIYDYPAKCPTIPDNISCGFKPTTPAPQNYQNYILSPNDSSMNQCKDSTGAAVQTLFTYQPYNMTNFNGDLLGDTASSGKLYSTLFNNGFIVDPKYVELEKSNYKNFHVSCPTITSTTSPNGISKNIPCQDIPAAKVQYFDVSNSQVASGSKINLFWTIKYPNTSCKIVGKHISDPNYTVLDTNSLIYNNSNNPGVSSFLGNVIDNLTSTSTLSSTLNGIPRKGKKVSGDLVSSSFASSSLGSDLLTITKSTQFVASCYFAPTNSTSTITKNVYVVGGGER